MIRIGTMIPFELLEVLQLSGTSRGRWHGQGCPSPMISLPPDLYAEIASQSTRETLLQLCGCSWTWYLIAASQLYSNISWQLNGPAAVAFMHTIATNKWLGSRVYSLNIHWDEPDQVHMFSPALRNMHNLEHLRVSDLAGSCEADPACVDTLLSLKKLQSIDWRWSDSFDLGVVLDRLHPLRCIRLEWDVRSSGALERAITRSHEVLQAIYLSDYPFKDLISQLADSVVFSRLATICVDELPLSVLVGNQFPALRMIDALYIRDLGLLRDPEFLPTLRSLCLTCNYFVDDSTNLQDAEGPTYPLISLRAGRQLSFLELDMTRIHHTNDSVGDDEINKLNRYLGSFHLPKLSSLSLIVTTSAQVELVMGCLDRLLTQEHALRVLVVHTQMAWNDEAVKTVRHVPRLAQTIHSHLYRQFAVFATWQREGYCSVCSTSV